MSLMYLILYMDRSNIGIAAPAIAKEFKLSKTAMGLVFSAFASAYAIGQMPAGWFGDRFGPKKVLLVIMPFWAVVATLTGATIGLTSLLSSGHSIHCRKYHDQIRLACHLLHLRIVERTVVPHFLLYVPGPSGRTQRRQSV
jgi:MFS family permease